jgi:hypothetical protein
MASDTEHSDDGPADGSHRLKINVKFTFWIKTQVPDKKKKKGMMKEKEEKKTKTKVVEHSFEEGPRNYTELLNAVLTRFGVTNLHATETCHYPFKFVPPRGK